tara:strand:+ start:120 stop:2123 length:2004 start_codon:yes stop_codon:yes gene_type:complete
MLTSPIYAALLDADATTLISSSTTESLFRLLDHDVLVAIVRQLLWQPLHPANFRAGHIAARDLAALLQTCRFWRDAVYANGQSERLEAAALASSCIPSAINGGEHRYFYQLLCQVRSAIHVTLLDTAIQLMVTHCALPHCSGAFRALQSYSTSVLSVDCKSSRYSAPRHALTRRALEGLTIQLAVAHASHARHGIVAAQEPRDGAVGGVLLATSRHGQKEARSFVYVHARKARVFSPISSLQRGLTIRPKVDVLCAAVCGDAIVLCHQVDEHEPVEGSRSHAISVWSSEHGTLTSSSNARRGTIRDIWVVPSTSTDKGAFLEIYTLVGSVGTTEEGHARAMLNVRVDRYALTTREWSFTQSTPIHLASERHYGEHWKYHSWPQMNDGSRCGIVLWDHSVATASPLGRVALVVAGWIAPLEHGDASENDQRRYELAYVYRVLMVSKRDRVKMSMFDSILPLEVEEMDKYEIKQRDVPDELHASGVLSTTLSIEDAVDRQAPEPHLSPCGTVLVTLPQHCGSATPADQPVKIFTFHPKRGWVLQSCHRDVDEWHGKPLDPFPDGLRAFAAKQEDMDLHEWIVDHDIGWRGQWRRSAFSPCGKYLMLLYIFHILVVDVHESLCNDRLRVRTVLVSGQTRPRAISWVDGLFLQTSHGVQHVGSYPTDSPRA